MKNLVIKGHATRGNEVIEILEMLGGKNSTKLVGSASSCGYYIDSDGNIAYHYYSSSYFNDAIQFTLEKFLEKYPYKVGDYVYINSIDYQGPGIIQNLYWYDDKNIIRYFVESNRCNAYWEVNELLPQKEQETTDTALAPDLKGEDYSGRRFGYKIPKGYEFECVRNNEIILKPIKPQYPKTYEECCKVLNLTKYPPALAPNKATYINQYKDFPCYYEIQKLAELLVCRNAYWKIAGEQMGLGKPWKPDWEKADERKYCIVNTEGNVAKWVQKTTNKILAFPTEEMRDAFYENFKDSIEQCKELL
jgi:hypothetical protein